MVAEGARDFVADDVAQHAAEDGGDHAHEHGDDVRHGGSQRELGATGDEQAEAECIRPQNGAFGGFEMPPAQEQHREQAEAEYGPQPG